MPGVCTHCWEEGGVRPTVAWVAALGPVLNACALAWAPFGADTAAELTDIRRKDVIARHDAVSACPRACRQAATADSTRPTVNIAHECIYGPLVRHIV